MMSYTDQSHGGKSAAFHDVCINNNKNKMDFLLIPFSVAIQATANDRLVLDAFAIG